MTQFSGSRVFLSLFSWISFRLQTSWQDMDVLPTPQSPRKIYHATAIYRRAGENEPATGYHNCRREHPCKVTRGESRCPAVSMALAERFFSQLRPWADLGDSRFSGKLQVEVEDRFSGRNRAPQQGTLNSPPGTDATTVSAPGGRPQRSGLIFTSPEAVQRTVSRTN